MAYQRHLQEFFRPSLDPMFIHEIGNNIGPCGRFSVAETVARSGIAATFSFGLLILGSTTILPIYKLTDIHYGIESNISIRTWYADHFWVSSRVLSAS